MEKFGIVLENCDADLENADVPDTGYTLVLDTSCSQASLCLTNRCRQMLLFLSLRSTIANELLHTVP